MSYYSINVVFFLPQSNKVCWCVLLHNEMISFHSKRFGLTCEIVSSSWWKTKRCFWRRHLCNTETSPFWSLWNSQLKWCTPTFTDEIFSRPFFAIFTENFLNFFENLTYNFFSRWLHLNNLCRESIAQDGMQVLQFFLQWLHLNNLCCESIAQDGMQVLQIFLQWLHLNNLHNLT